MTPTEFLIDLLEYYTVDPKKRINKSDSCKYAPILSTSDGCALGRYLPLAIAQQWDILGEDIMDLCNRYNTPPILKNLSHNFPGFLSDCQLLHDTSINWDDKGLTIAGKDFIRYICRIKSYNLDISDFTRWLDDVEIVDKHIIPTKIKEYASEEINA